MHVDNPVVPQLDAHLANGLEERQRLDVTHRTADLDETDIGIAGATLDAFLDLVSDVRNHLHGRTEVVTTTLLGDHALVNAPRREVAVAPGRCIRTKRS